MTVPSQFAYSLAGIHGRPALRRSEQAEVVGHICQLARRQPQSAKGPLDAFMRLLDCAYQLRQFKLYFNDFGQCVGYVCWASVTPEVEQRLLNEPEYLPHLLEWNEGARLWILGFGAARGSLPQIRADLRDVVFHDRQMVMYVRHAHGRQAVHQISRQRTSARSTPAQ